MPDLQPSVFRSMLIFIGLVVALLVVNAAIAYRSINDLHNDTGWVIHTREALEALEGTLASIRAAESGQRGYLISGDEEYLTPYHAALKELPAQIDHFAELTRDNEAQQQRIVLLRERIDTRLKFLKDALDVRREEGFDAVRGLIVTHRGRNAMDSLMEVLEEIRVAEAQLLADRQRASQATYLRAISAGATSTVLGLLMFGVCVFLMQRGLRSRERAASEIFRERERLRVTLESIGDGVIATDGEGRVRFLNSVAQGLTGWSLEEARGLPLIDVFPIFNEDTRARVENPVERALRDGVIVGLANHTILRAKDGSERPIDDSAAPIRKQDGTLDGAVLVFRDVTEQRSSARELLESEARKAAVVETALDGIITIDTAGRVVEFNRAAEAMFGYALQDVIGEALAELIVPPAYRERHQAGIARYLLTDEAPILNQRIELPAMHAQGHEFPVELSITRIGAGHAALFTAYIRDITQRKQSEEALNDRMRLLAMGSEVGKALVSGRTLPEMLELCAKTMVEQLDAAAIRIWLFNSDNILELQACAGLPLQIQAAEAKVPLGQYATGRIAQERRARITHTLAGDEQLPEPAWESASGLAAFAGYPLIVEEKLVGVVAIFSRRTLSAHTLEVIATVANQMALGIDNKQSEEALQQARRDLEQRVAERTVELRTAHSFLQAVLENIEDGVVACDPDGAITLFNRATREFHGLPAEPVPPEDWSNHYDLYRADGVKMSRDEVPLFRALQGEQVRDVEMVIAPKEGRSRTLVASGQSLRDADGNNLGAVVSMHDVTERKLAEQELQAFALQLQRSNRELEQFASVASHDLQEPLRKIQTFGDRLQARYAEALGEQGGEYVTRMRDAATRMRALVEGLLTFSRVTTKAQPFTPVDIRKVTQEVLSDLENRVNESGATVELGELPVILADPLQMRQLLQNLLSNALKFQQSDVPPIIRVTSVMVRDTDAHGEQHEFCELHVRDNGIGFEEVYVDRIFEVFQRLHSHSEYEGTGIGLAICRKIAERHGGSITAKSQTGQGSEFIVRLRIVT
ncbi:MAG TPA: PAS domain S-box protein [Pirellulaceae bacterium]|nr:PAS domain S-box protein [Pirellulaceae bacterium]